MAQNNQNQPVRLASQLTVTPAELTVEHWREKAAKLISQFKSVPVAADQLGALSDHFAGARGYNRLHNVVSNRAGLQITAEAVRLMELALTDNAPKSSAESEPA